ncbi:unnamed protein product [Rhizoctonia solani]|uniref:Uncharacterized protein n=1 Tax=Rhizoctonia solani TaxID=456999 RepID=A0A8H3E2G6_9AGAM|nr:unnamed protein product [Rhizoctonia solani]
MPHRPVLNRILNGWLAAKRKPWEPEDSVRILFSPAWKEGNKLFDWYNDRANSFIKTIQLRKEREPPFFHEYITFSLGDNGGYFRVDRHQRPNETHPLAAISDDGVESYDTISRIHSLDDDKYGSSDCLIEITFSDDAQVHLHYSCTFYSQAIVLCILQNVIMETVQGHTPSLVNNEMAIGSDVVLPEPERSNPPVPCPNSPHQNYPGIDFVTDEDKCSVCWRLALSRRALPGNNEIISLENLAGLFWDGVVRVAEHFIQHLDIAADSGNGSWFLSPGVHLVELCQELTYQAVHDTWVTRLQYFEQNLVYPEEMSPKCICLCPGSERLAETQRNEVGNLGHDPPIVTTNIRFPTRVELEGERIE